MQSATHNYAGTRPSPAAATAELSGTCVTLRGATVSTRSWSAAGSDQGHASFGGASRPVAGHSKAPSPFHSAGALQDTCASFSVLGKSANLSDVPPPPLIDRTEPAASRRSVLMIISLLAFCLTGTAAPETQETVAFFKEQYAEAEKAYEDQPTNMTAALALARAAFDLAEYPTNTAQRVALAEQGIAAARKVVARDPESAGGHYYLGMNLGQLARTRGIGALKLVDEMEREFHLARNLDPQFDYAGPHRNLGQLYRDAPSLLSIGSRSKARHHLQEAVKLAPNFPENRLLLLESYLKWGDRNGAVRELKALNELLPTAREKYTGPKHAGTWIDWDRRLREARARVDAGSGALKSPRDEE